MRLALVFGESTGNVLKDKLVRQKDNLDIEVFGSVPMLIDSSIKRGRTFDRIIVLSNLINAVAMSDLHQYWHSLSGIETQVVLLCKANKEESLAKDFLTKFQSPLVAAMLVENSSLRIVVDAALSSIAKLNENYGIKGYLDVELEDSEVSFELPQAPEQHKDESTKVEEVKKPEPKPAEKPAKKSKGGLFGAIFGTRGSEPEKKQEPVKPQEPAKEVETEQIIPEQVEIAEPEPQFITPEPEPVFEEAEQDFSDAESFAPVYEVTDEEPLSIIQEPEPVMNPIMDDDTEISIESPVSDDFSPEDDFEEMTENSDVIGDEQSLLQNDFDFTPDSAETEETTELFDVDEDFGSETLFGVAQETVSKQEPQDVAEVDTDLGDLNLASAEEEYRKATERPKIIEKEVVREVIRETGGSTTLLKGVLSGRFKKVIIVTGDRGTGITSTAMNMANYFSKSVNTLYFDCDTERHGLLDYIDYSAFRAYESRHMNGTKLCKSVGAFTQCAVSFDTNLDILTSDFSCDTTDDELIETQSVVAEVSTEYGVVIVDCPMDKFHLLMDLHLTSCFVICVEGTKRGMMNMLCNLESLDIPTRVKRSIANKGMMLITKSPKNLDFKKLQRFVESIYEPSDGIDWLAMEKAEFNGKFNEKLLNSILEG